MPVVINGSGTISGISAGGLPDSSVTTAEIADSAVTTAKIADSNVTTAKINNSAVTTDKINDNAVTAAKISATGTPSATTFLNGAGEWASAVIPGEIKMWPTSSAPSGYLLCNGSAVSRTTYATLFALFGTTFGAGDGSTTFNVPNFVNRMPIGAGSSYAANSQGGSADATLVSHTHSVSDPGHTHTVQATTIIPYTSSNSTPAASNLQNTTSTTIVKSATTGISISATGSSATNANLPPYIGIYFIIKT